MDYSFIIRRANSQDAVAIKDILNESFTNYKNDTGITGALEALTESVEAIRVAIESVNVYIAIVDEVPVGTVRLSINADGTAYLSRFGVKSSSRSIGIGKALMNLVNKLMKEKGVSRLTLHTASKNRELIHFYYGAGFYIESISTDRGYLRALLVKDF